MHPVEQGLCVITDVSGEIIPAILRPRSQIGTGFAQVWDICVWSCCKWIIQYGTLRMLTCSS